MARRNQVIYAGSVAWTQDESAAKTIDVPIPDLGIGDGEQYLVSVKNGSAVVSLTVSVGNMVNFSGSAEACEIASFSVATSSKSGKVVTGWPLCEGGRLTLTKSASTAAAFTAYVEVRKA